MKKIIIYTDGGSRGNPGKAGIGVVYANEKDQTVKTYSEYLGDDITNNEAEYMGIIIALKKFKTFFSKKLALGTEVEMRADSELVVKQLNGEYKILNEKIQTLFIQVWNLKFDFKKVTFKHIPREKNREADGLANEAMDSKSKAQRLF
tara:strand:- start:30 stop:473 length:444 start_codon:yes stop_codon:yes gene_type:complete